MLLDPTEVPFLWRRRQGLPSSALGAEGLLPDTPGQWAQTQEVQPSGSRAPGRPSETLLCTKLWAPAASGPKPQAEFR